MEQIYGRLVAIICVATVVSPRFYMLQKLLYMLIIFEFYY